MVVTNSGGECHDITATNWGFVVLHKVGDMLCIIGCYENGG